MNQLHREARKLRSQYGFEPISSREKTISVRSFLFFVLLVGFALFAVSQRNNTTSYMKLFNNDAEETDVLADNKNGVVMNSLTDLSVAIRDIIAEQQGIYSVRFEDLDSREAFGINDEQVMIAASVIKVPILASLYHLASNDEIDLDQKITIATSDVQDWGTGSIRYETPPIVHTNRELAQLLMEKSDNTAAYVLTHRVLGEEKIQSLIDQWELTNTNLTENEITNKDMSKLLRMMFEGNVANEQLTTEMIGWMDESDFEDRLPVLLPSDATVYHKIGNEVRVINDVGIIEYEGKRWYIGILTADIPDEEEAKRIIAKISKTVYDYQAR